MRIKRIRAMYDQIVQHKEIFLQMLPMQEQLKQLTGSGRNIRDQDLDTLPEIANEKRQKFIDKKRKLNICSKLIPL